MALSIESESPRGRGETDVLTMIDGVGPIPTEVKVFDGKNRSNTYIKKGLDQAADYGR